MTRSLPRRLGPAVVVATVAVAALARPAAAVVGAPPAQEGEVVITAAPAVTRAQAAAALAELATAVRGPLEGLALADVAADAPAAVLHAIAVVRGRVDGTFGPDEPLTRGQLASLASRLLAELRGTAPARPAATFGDLAGHPHADGILAASRDVLVVGRPDGTFGPDDPATPRHLETVASRLRAVLEAEGLLAGDPMPEPVIVTFGTPDGSFRVLLDQPAAINRVAGAEPGTHVGIPNGRILPGDGGVNTGHGWHLVEVEIVDATIEVCDGTANDIDDIGLDAWYATQGDRYCPWGAVLLGSEPATP
jgi:hypothetical protein